MNAYLWYGISHLSPKGKTRRQRRLTGAVIGIGLSLVPLLLVIQVSGGMIQGITNRYIEVGSFHLQIRHFDKPDPEAMDALANAVSRIDGVRGVYPGYAGIALASGSRGQQGVSVRAIPQEVYERDEEYRRYLSVVSGSFDLRSPGSMLLSVKTAESLGATAGDTVRLLTSFAVRPGKLILKQSTFTVNGVVSSGYADIDESTAMISPSDGKRLFKESGAAFIGVKVSDPYNDVERVYREINGIAPRNWYPFTWYDLDRSLFKSFQTTQALLVFVMSLILVTAAANVSSSMIMLVMEKQDDIALLIAAGANPKRVARSFVYTGFAIGLLGSILGCGLGLLVAVQVNTLIRLLDRAINAVSALIFEGGAGGSFALLSPDYYLESIPITIGFAETMGAAALAVICSTVAAFFPALKASRIDPAVVLARR